MGDSQKRQSEQCLGLNHHRARQARIKRTHTIFGKEYTFNKLYLPRIVQ